MASSRVQISVLNYNGEKFLADAIESALAQTVPVSVVVIDDCSTDGSEAVAARYRDRGVRFVRNPHNLGLSANWTHAARDADADYVAVLHQDDRIRPEFAEVLAARLDEAPDAVAAICNTQVVSVDLEPMHVARFDRKRRTAGGRFDEREYQQLLLGNFIYGCSWLARPAMFEQWQFEQRFGWVPDWNLWLSVLADPTRVVREPRVLSEYRLHDESLSFGQQTLMRRLGEERIVVEEALARRPVPASAARAARRMIDVRALVYAIQVVADGRLRAAGAMLRQMIRMRGLVGVARGIVGLAVLPDLWATVAARVRPRSATGATDA